MQYVSKFRQIVSLLFCLLWQAFAGIAPGLSIKKAAKLPQDGTGRFLRMNRINLFLTLITFSTKLIINLCNNRTTPGGANTQSDHVHPWLAKWV